MFTIYLSSFSGESTERSLWVKHVWGEKECTKENLFEILWNRTGIRLCLTFSHWFGTKLVRFVWNQLENSKYNLISSWFNKLSRKVLCVHHWSRLSLVTFPPWGPLFSTRTNGFLFRVWNRMLVVGFLIFILKYEKFLMYN